jgi:hypothetical protein
MKENLPMVVDPKSQALAEAGSGEYMRKRARQIHQEEMKPIHFGMADEVEQERLKKK